MDLCWQHSEPHGNERHWQLAFFLVGTLTMIFLLLLYWHMKQSCLLSLVLQVLTETLKTVIVSYSEVDIFLATGNIVGKLVSELSQVFCQGWCANQRKKNSSDKLNV